MVEMVELNTAEQVVVPRKEYEKLLADHAKFKFQLEELLRLVYGSRSERFVPAQVPGQASLFEVEATGELPQQEVSYTRTRPQERKQPVREAIAAHLPRVERVIEPENIPEGAKRIGQEVTETLEYTPGSIHVDRIVRPKYAAADSVIIAPMPSLPFYRSNLGATLAAFIMVCKFADHLPFYRLRQILARSGLDVGDSTLGDWFKATARLLGPLYDVLRQKIFGDDYLQVDESPIAVQDNHKKGTTHTGYQWVVHSPVQRAVLFAYHPGRAAAFPNEMFASYKGALQTDGYSGYNNLMAREDITPLACMAHARRKFDKALTNDKVRAEHALLLFAKLYDIERTCAKEGMDPGQRKQYRELHARPVLEQIGHWLKEQILLVAPKSPIGTAIAYTLGLWPRLCGYLADGRYLIDNNPIENTIRPMAIGRKNYLFAGSHSAAQDAALMYSLLGTCKLHGVEPLAYLSDVIARISEHKANKLYELLPQNWQPLAK